MLFSDLKRRCAAKQTKQEGRLRNVCYDSTTAASKEDTRKKNTKYGSKTAVAESTSTTDLRKESSVQIATSVSPGEYMSTTIQQFLKSQGSVHQTTCVGTPQQNGVAERKNRHLLEVVRASRIQAHMPLSYWGETLASAAYLINRTPSSSLGFQTPFQVLNNAIMSPNVPNLPPHVFGCVAFVHLPQQDKLSPRALRCVFVGYALHQKGYRCYHPPSRKIYITMDVVFHEDIMYYLSESEFQGEYNKEEIHTLTYLPPEESQSSIEIVNLQDTGKANGDDSQAEISEDTFGEHNNSDTTAIENESHEEIPNQSSVEDVPTTSPIKRILSQRQNRGIPKPTYEPDFSSIVNYPMSHFVSNHRLSESNQSFVNQLSAVSIPNSVQEALKDPKWEAAMNDEMRSLQKNQIWELVDLPPEKKPVGCRWIYTIKYKADGSIERYKARLVAKGYTQTYGIDYTDMFAPAAKINIIRILLSLPVNLDWPVQQFDVVTGNDEEETEVLQKYLSREFEMKDLGALKYFLGIELVRFIDTPIEEGLKFCITSDQVPVDKGRYQRLIGRLMYLSHTRPDLAYALSVVRQFMHNPGEQHMKAVMRILRSWIDQSVYHRDAKESKVDVIWRKLETIYEQPTAHNKVNLMKRLVNLKYKEGRSTTEYISEFQGLVDQLTTMKNILDDELQVLLLLSSLPDNWETLVVSVNNSVSNGKLTLNMVTDRLQNEESRRKSVEAVPSKSDALISEKKERWGRSQSLYGLKQAPRQWYKKFDSFMENHGFNMAGDVDSRKSLSEYLLTFARRAVSWQSKLQQCVALSTTEAEYIAITEGCKETL
ncbi:retrovirus-related pol polyprotein from transposon RE1 [Citrus sinensis]|uniref:Retrovirus-related pol polyprotein from transposon RE1 n=1 Tax=Citrus sinensis TaxID=2711 RepID=A0ACB8MFR1_CITSI|nr:retrovirus-related pol polyprotein from transposon RE1 [Citrus sinensis]